MTTERVKSTTIVKEQEDSTSVKLKLDEKKKKIKILKEDKEKLENELNAIKKKYKRQQTSNEDLEEIREKYETTETDLRAKLKDQLQKNTDLQERVALLHSENDAFKLKFEKLEEEKQKLKEDKDKRKQSLRDLERELEDAKDRLLEKDREIQKLNDSYRALQKELDTLKNSKKESGKNAVQEAELERLRQQLESEQKNSASLSESKAKEDVLQKKIRELEQQNKAYSANKEALDELKKQLLAEQAEIARLRKALDQQEGQSTAEIKKALEAVNAKLKDRITLSKVEKIRGEDKKAVNEATEVQLRTQAEIESHGAARKVLRSKVPKVRAQIDYLRMEKKRLKNLKNEFVQECNNLGDILEACSKVEVNLSSWRKKLEKHLKNPSQSPLGKNQEEISMALTEVQQVIIGHEWVRQEANASEIKKQNAYHRLKDQVFTLGRVLEMENYGILTPKEIPVDEAIVELKQQLEKEKGAREVAEAAMKDKNQQQAQINKVKATVIESMIKAQKILFPDTNNNEKSVQDEDKFPQIFTRTIDFIEEKALQMEDILGKEDYKAAKVKQIKIYFDKGYDVDLSKCGDYWIVGEILKMYFKDLAEPLLTFELYESFLQIADKLETERPSALQQVIARLPPTNKAILETFLRFLSKLVAHKDKNLMTPEKLGAIFGPYLLKPNLEGAVV